MLNTSHLPLAVALTLTLGVALTVVAATEKLEVKDQPTIFQTAQTKLAPFHSQILAERAQQPSDSIAVKHAAFAKKLVKKKKKSSISKR